MITYEQPLNEKIRLFFRLEALFSRFDEYLEQETTLGSHTALISLLELHDMTSRLDVKSAILKIIDHQSNAIRLYEENTDVDAEQLSKIVTMLEDMTRELYSYHGQLGQHLKANYFLNTIRQRMNIAGGVNGYDVPLFNLWLSQPYVKRKKQLNEWAQPYNHSREAITVVMNLIRNSARAEQVVAENGFYQSSMDGIKNAQMIRIELPDGSKLYPEVSAGKQRFSIRFVQADTFVERAQQIRRDVEFNLVVCGF